MRIYYAQADFGGCGFYRILQQAAFLKFVLQHDVKVVFRLGTLEEMLTYDLIIMQRQYKPSVLELVKTLRAQGKKVIYEIDDDLWDVPEGNRSKVYWTEDKIAGAESVIRVCDAVTTSTEPLAALLRSHGKNVFVIPNYIPEIKPLPKFDSIIKVGWSGSVSHQIDFNDEIISALKDIKKKYKGHVELVFCGWIPEGLVGHVTFYEPVPPMDYLYFLNELRLHVGIMPCIDVKFNQCKSNLKFLEYSITKTASIASRIYPYEHTITADTGTLVNNGSYREWFEAIERLIEDAGLRNHMADSAYDFVRNNYLMMNKVAEIEKIYNEVLK